MIDAFMTNKELIQIEHLGDKKIAQLRKTLKCKLIPMVFYACDEDNYVCAFYAWQSILKCVNLVFELEENFWSLLNAKKAFVPKLISLLRSHANGNANNQNIDVIFVSLRPLFAKLTKAFENDDEKISFYHEFFAKLYDVITKETSTVNKLRNNSTASRNKVICAFFDCLNLNENELSQSEQYFDFYQQTTSNYVRNFQKKI